MTICYLDTLSQHRKRAIRYLKERCGDLYVADSYDDAAATAREQGAFGLLIWNSRAAAPFQAAEIAHNATTVCYRDIPWEAYRDWLDIALDDDNYG